VLLIAATTSQTVLGAHASDSPTAGPTREQALSDQSARASTAADTCPTFNSPGAETWLVGTGKLRCLRDGTIQLVLDESARDEAARLSLSPQHGVTADATSLDVVKRVVDHFTHVYLSTPPARPVVIRNDDPPLQIFLAPIDHGGLSLRVEGTLVGTWPMRADRDTIGADRFERARDIAVSTLEQLRSDTDLGTVRYQTTHMLDGADGSLTTRVASDLDGVPVELGDAIITVGAGGQIISLDARFPKVPASSDLPAGYAISAPRAIQTTIDAFHPSERLLNQMRQRSGTDQPFRAVARVASGKRIWIVTGGPCEARVDGVTGEVLGKTIEPPPINDP
jgi:hypothetical protein